VNAAATLTTLLSLAAPSQDADELLAGLIEESRELSSFRAVYSMSGRKEDGTELVGKLVMRLDDERARLDLDVAGSARSVWVLDETFALRVWEEDELTAWAEFHVDPYGDIAAIAATFAEVFPGIDTDAGFPTGPVFQIQCGMDPVTERAKLDCNLSRVRRSRGPLGWLGWLTRAGLDAEVREDVLVYSDPSGVEVAIARASGFLERVRLSSPSKTIAIDLVELETDAVLGDEDFDVPETTAGAQDVSAELGRQAMMLGLEGQRGEVLHAVARALREGGLVWDEEAQSALGTSLAEVHGRVMARRVAHAIGELNAEVERFLAALDDALASGTVEPERLRAGADDWRSQLAQVIDAEGEGALEALDESFPIEDDEDWAQAIRRIEREIVARAFDELVRVPVLEELDEEIASRLD
jgi:hypothetical protein